MTADRPIPDEEALPLALACWSGLAGARVAPLGTGLINRTFRVDAPRGVFVLQRVNPIFDPAIHDNIAAVTARLAERGIATPVLVDADEGSHHVELRGGGGVWRLMTLVPGACFDVLGDPGQARAAANLVARFHAALDDLPHRFVGLRLGVHDTARHLDALRASLDELSAHRLHAEVAPLGRALLASAAVLPPLPDLPPRVCHGDLKIGNVIFEGATAPGSHRARALVDLDTVGPMALAHELGDALRSWCNPGGEDQAAARFDLDIFAAAVSGYQEGLGRALTLDERLAILLGPEWISLELSARFAADALRDSYFGWSPSRFETRGDHNLARARSQLALHRDVVASREARAALLALRLG